jgi:sigma-E factor negative regulatory protein RseA
MNDQIKDQISAFLDDELSGDESAFLVRRLESNPEAHKTVIRYATIGAALRRELLQPEPGILRRRLAMRFEGGQAPAVAAPRAARAGMGWPLLGFGLAASMAVIGLLVLQMVDSNDRARAPLSVRDAASTPGGATPYTVLGGSTSVQPTRLTNYMVHHGEFASGLGRTWIHANVVGSREVQNQLEDATWR